jgi:Uma2 family endonuclease
MASSALVPSYTLADLVQFPDDGNRYELLDGFLLVTPAPRMPHDVVTMRLTECLMAYLRPGNHGGVFTRGAVQIAPNTHLEPDVLVIPPLDRLVPALFAGIDERER